MKLRREVLLPPPNRLAVGAVLVGIALANVSLLWALLETARAVLP